MDRSRKQKKPLSPDRNTLNEPYVEWTLPDAASKIDQGLSTDILDTIQSRLQLSNRELADLLMISPRTLDRRRKEETLPVDESDRCFRIARLLDMALELFGDSRDKLSIWFKTSNPALGDKPPLHWIKSQPGSEIVERTLAQLRHGIPV